MIMIMRLNEIRRHQFLEETEKAKELYLKTITEIGLKEDPNWELEEDRWTSSSMTANTWCSAGLPKISVISI